MLESLLITFRETLEAGLVVFIILSYLKKSHHKKYCTVVYAGVLIALFTSVLLAWLFHIFVGGLEGSVEAIFEGTLMFVAAFLLTTMILWMARAKHVQHQIESQVAVEISDRHIFGLFAVAFIAVLREGVETVIFLSATFLKGSTDLFFGAGLGILLALLLVSIFFYTAHRLPLKTFFRFSSVLLIFFAAGLVAHGVHEFQEIHWLPFLTTEAWDINPALLPDGSYPLFHEKGFIGSLLKGLFGYNGNPSLLEVVTYLFYSVSVFSLYYRIACRAEKKNM